MRIKQMEVIAVFFQSKFSIIRGNWSQHQLCNKDFECREGGELSDMCGPLLLSESPPNIVS